MREQNRDAPGGLIPAHAGKTQIQVLKAHLGDGSSPLTRGKLLSFQSTNSLMGLIPAHAGKTGGKVRRLCD